MSDLLARLRRDLNASRKAQDKGLTLLLGTTLSETQNRALELGRELTESDVIEVLRRAIKKRRESEEAYGAAGRPELAEREKQEATQLEAYLPPMLGDDEIRAAVRAAIDGGASAIGAVMGRVMPALKGKADGARINTIVREELAARG